MYCYKSQPRDYRQHPDHIQKFSERLKAVADVLGMGKIWKICLSALLMRLPSKLMGTQLDYGLLAKD